MHVELSPARRWGRLLLLGGCLVIALGIFGVEPAGAQRATLDIPPRLQWNANYGYCGETSFISAGLCYGQFCGQYVARGVASPGMPQSKSDSQLLLGVNDLATAKKMRLVAEGWDAPSGKTGADFLVWVKNHVFAGHPVVIGVFTNEFLFYNDRNKNAGDPDYDHIVPVVAMNFVERQAPASGVFSASDWIAFSDNGLWGSSSHTPYRFQYGLNSFRKTRSEANSPNGSVYSLKVRGNYGVAITGVADTNGDTIPVRLATSVNYERPSMKNGSNNPPTAMKLQITATVSLPNKQLSYNLYRYDKFDDVPTSRFNANASKAAQVWHIGPRSSSKYSVTMTISSDETAVFRAVRASAP